MNTQNAEQIMKRGSTLDKPKKTPRVRVIMSAKELSPNWADHEVHSNYRRPRIKFSDARPTSQESENDSDEERDSSKHPEDCEGASDDTTGEESDVMSVDEEVTSSDGEVGQRKNEEFPKAPDHINTIIHEWGKGTTCELR